jgi:hypothetical protein
VRRGLAAVVVAAVLPAVLGVLAAPSTRAAYDPVGGGVTKLSLDKGFLAFLKTDHVTLGATTPARKTSGSLVLPNSGGQFDPTTGKGEVETEGTITLRSARKRVPIRKLVVKTARSPVVAKVGGSQLKLVTSARLSSRRDGFATAFSARQLLLTAKVATRLNKKLRPEHPFTAGQLVGTLLSKPVPLVTTIVPTGRATLVFDGAFTATLDRHFVALNPIFPAEHNGSTFTLPIIANGTLAPDASQGTLRTGGEIEFLQLGAGQIFWHELWVDVASKAVLAEVDLEPTPAFPGKLGQVPILGLGNGTVVSDPGARTIGLTGVPLTLMPEIAAAFNQAFAGGKPDFTAGELVGTLSFDAQGQ